MKDNYPQQVLFFKFFSQSSTKISNGRTHGHTGGLQTGQYLFSRFFLHKDQLSIAIALHISFVYILAMSIIQTSGNNVSNWIHSLFQEKSSFGTILVDCSAKMDIGENTNYNDFRFKGRYCDVVLESSEGVQFPAHRIVLENQSIYVSFCKNRKKS